MNALSAARDGDIYDYVGGLADLEARRVRFIGDRGSASPRTICASCGSSASTPPTATAQPDPAGLAACIAARAGLDQLSRERVRMELMKLLLAPRAAPTLAVMGKPACCCACWAACPISRASPTWPRSRPRSACRADPVRRLGALGVLVAEDAERLWQSCGSPTPSTSGSPRWREGWWRMSPARARGGARAALSARARSIHRSRAARPGRARARRARRGLARACDAAAALDRAGVPASRPRISSRAAWRRARRSAPRCARPRSGLDRGWDFRRTRRR